MTLTTDLKDAGEEVHFMTAEQEDSAHAESGCESDGDGSRRGGKPSMKEVAACFHLPIEVAAKQLGVGQTWLKLLCRSNGVARWPFRKIQSLQNSLDRSKKMQSLVEVAKVINQNLPKWLDLEGEAPRMTIPAANQPDAAAAAAAKTKAPAAPDSASAPSKPEPLHVAADAIARPKALSLDTGAWRRPIPLSSAPPPSGDTAAVPITAATAGNAGNAAGNAAATSAAEYAFQLRVLAQQQQALSAIAAELGPVASAGPGSATLPLLTGSPGALQADAAARQQREWGSALQHALAQQHLAAAQAANTQLAGAADLNSALTATSLADLYRQRLAATATSQPAAHAMPVLPLYCEPGSLMAGLRTGYGPPGTQPYVVSSGFEQLFAASAAQQPIGLEQVTRRS